MGFLIHGCRLGPLGPLGPRGPMGPLGPMGAMGPMGPKGPMGPMGPMGRMGPMGPMAPMGPMGPIGPMGPMGPIGPMGPTQPHGHPLYRAARHFAAAPPRLCRTPPEGGISCDPYHPWGGGHDVSPRYCRHSSPSGRGAAAGRRRDGSVCLRGDS